MRARCCRCVWHVHSGQLQPGQPVALARQILNVAECVAALLSS